MEDLPSGPRWSCKKNDQERPLWVDVKAKPLPGLKGGNMGTLASGSLMS